MMRSVKMPLQNEYIVLRRAIMIFVPINIFLLFVGVLQYPPVLGEGGWKGLIAASLIVLLYGWLTLFSPISIGSGDTAVIQKGIMFGILAGVMLSVDLISGYLIHNGDTSARTSLVAYGLFFILITASAVRGFRQTGKFASGLTAALWCVLVALLIWFCVEFVAYYVFASTPSGMAFIQDEMQLDFARSGATDYQAFVISDFYGAGFFHLLLGLIIALILGTIGAGIGRLSRRTIVKQIN